VAYRESGREDAEVEGVDSGSRGGGIYGSSRSVKELNKVVSGLGGIGCGVQEGK